MIVPDRDRLPVVVYGDSLGMPRASDGISYDRTYAELLRETCEDLIPGMQVDLYNRSRSAGTVVSLCDAYREDMIYFGRPGGVLIVQCGVCDCAPRPVP